MLRAAERSGLLNADALSMIEGALAVADLQVRDIMIPRSGMVVIERGKTPEEFIATVIESGHSRFPIVGESRDDIEGILLAKDLLGYFTHGRERGFDLRDAMRPASFVPESKRLNVLLREFRTSRNHMAVVVDEWGGVAGLVTIEDVLEQIVGEIDDEHDVEEEEGFVTQVKPGEFVVKALMPVEDFNRQFGATFDEEEFDTVGGIVVKAFGYLPERGEERALGGLRFSVLRADQRRVHLFRVVTAG